MRLGLFGKKVGMTRLFTDNGEHIPVTAIKLEEVSVIGLRESKEEAKIFLKVAYGQIKEKSLKKPHKGIFDKCGQQPKKFIAEFPVDATSTLSVGDKITMETLMLDIGQKVDITGISIGKGFAGPMKRHNFSGLRASHGVSLAHRSHGSTGMCQDPGKVFKNKKMAGHMGNKRVTVQNLDLVDRDLENSVLFVKGCIPGPKGSFVQIRSAIKTKK